MSSNKVKGSARELLKITLVPPSESSKRRQAADGSEPSLLGPVALMALGLTGAAAVAASGDVDSSAPAQDPHSTLPDGQFSAQPDLFAVDNVATESASAVAAQMNDLIHNLLAEKAVSGQSGGLTGTAAQELVSAAMGAEELVADTASGALVQMAGGGAANAEAELPLLFAQAASAAEATGVSDGAVAAGAGVASTSAATAGGMSAGAVVAAVVAGLAVAGAASSSSSDAPSKTTDTTAPVAPTLVLATDSGMAGDAKTNVGVVNVSGLEAGASWQYSVNGGAFTTGTGTSVTLSGDGDKSVTVRQTDVAGNTSAASSALAFTLDATAPVIQSLVAHSANKTIVLTFDSALDAAHLPIFGAFAITTGGVVNPVASLVVTGNVLTLTLTNAFTAGAVSLTYTDPSAADDADAAQDIAGNDAASVIQGTLADGYIRGAQIYIDTNMDGVADASEMLVGVVTDANGNFFLPSSAPAGTLIAVGGVNIDTGVANTLALKAPAGSTTVNPLTTLVQAVIDAAPTGTTITADDAAISVAVALGLNLPAGTSLTTYDPLSATGDDALVVQKAAAQVATVLSLASSAPAAGSTATQAVDTVVSNLVAQVNTAVTSSTPINLGNASIVGSLFLGAVDATGAGAQAVTDAQTAVASIATAANLAEVSTAQSVALDNTAPATPGIDLVGSSDTGTSATDNITNDTTPTLRVSLEVNKTDGTAVVVGDTVAIKNGSTQVGTTVLNADHLAQGFVDVTLNQQTDATYNLTSVIFDKAGNTSNPSTAVSITVDTLAPTATIVLADSALKAGDTSLVTITFNEAVTGLTNADLSIAYGSLTTLASVDNGLTWTATYTPTADLTDASNVITLANTGVSDAAGNAGAGTTDSANFVIDTLRPTATIVLADSALKAGETSLVTITFNEAVTGLANADLSIANGTLTTLASVDNGLTWTATYTPTADLTDASNVITLANTGVSDAAGNAGVGTTDSANFAIDTLAPTATIVLADSALKAGDTSLVTITFNEAVTDFANADLTVVNGGLTAVASTDGGVTWTATYTPTIDVTDASNVITLANTGVTDAAGNAGVGTTNSANFEIDTFAPIVIPLSPADGGLTLGLAANLVLTATETLVKGSGTVSIFKSDNSLVEIIDVTDARVSITGAGANTQISIDPGADFVKDTQYYVKVGSGAFTDVAGNAWAGIADATGWNFTGAGATVVVDSVAGNDVINLVESGQPITVSGTLGAEASVLAAYTAANMTVVLNPVTGTAVTLTNLSYSYTSGTTGIWSAVVPASVLSGTGDYTLNVTFTGATDTAAAGIVGVGTKTVHVDTETPATPPVVGLTTDSTDGGNGHGTDLVTKTAGLTVTGTESGATVEYSLNGTSGWTTTVLTAVEGSNTVYVRQTDVAGNVSVASSAFTYTLDTAANAPTVGLTTDSTDGGTGHNTDLVTKTAGLTVTGTESGATVEYSLNGTTGWTTTAPTAAEGSNTVYVRQTDVAGNVSAASSALTFALDTTAPTVVISDPSIVLNSTTGALSFGFTFSEAVTGFDATDVTVENGTKGSVVKIDDSHYSLLVTPTSSSAPVNLTVAVPAAGATDIAGNASAVVASQFLASILYGTAGSDTLTVGPSLDHIFLGAGADVIKLTSTAHSTLAAPDDVMDFGLGDKIDLSALLGAGGSGYTGSALGDSGAGFVELKNLTLSQNAVANTTTVKFDVHFDAAEIGTSKITGAVIDLAYDYAAIKTAQVVSAQYTDPDFGTLTNVWSVVTPNLSGGTANGKIGVLADQTTIAGNPILDANGNSLSVTLIVNGLVNTFSVGLEAKSAGGVTEIITADNVIHNVDVGITKTAGVTIGVTGTLEIITDTSALGTVGDNQLHMVSTYDSQNNTTHLQVQYDTSSTFGTTVLSDVIAIDFDGDVRVNLTPAHLTFI